MESDLELFGVDSGISEVLTPLIEKIDRVALEPRKKQRNLTDKRYEL
jgi:hypothetical protein